MTPPKPGQEMKHEGLSYRTIQVVKHKDHVEPRRFVREAAQRLRKTGLFLYVRTIPRKDSTMIIAAAPEDNPGFKMQPQMP